MRPEDDPGLLSAAEAINADAPVDWDALESSGAVNASFKAVLRELRVVGEIARLHRVLPQSVTSPLPSEVASSPGADHVPAARSAGESATPVTWGPLRLLERVGDGAFGDVFRAWDPRLDREVALKIFRRDGPRAESVGSQIIGEGRMLARVRHPNVVTVYGADRAEGQVGLWMEFVRGRTLEAVLRDHGPFGAPEAAMIGLDLCRALSAVHAAGLIHRDVKAQNVMREAGGRLVLMDFGTGREARDEMRPDLAGTPLYLAPEVLEGAPATTKSDIYSLGVLLFHLVTASYPVTGTSVADIRAAHRQRRRTWLRDARPDLPLAFVQVVERALDPDAARRFESAGALEVALGRVVVPGEMPARAAAPAAAVTGPALVPGPRRPRLIEPPVVIGAALMAVAVAALAFLAPPMWPGGFWAAVGRVPLPLASVLTPITRSSSAACRSPATWHSGDRRETGVCSR